jgi:hypothetical protein
MPPSSLTIPGPLGGTSDGGGRGHLRITGIGGQDAAVAASEQGTFGFAHDSSIKPARRLHKQGGPPRRQDAKNAKCGPEERTGVNGGNGERVLRCVR